MISKLIALFILYLAWCTDHSGIRKFVLIKMGRKKALEKLNNDYVFDRRIELYKTIDCVIIACYFLNLKYGRFIIFAIIFIVLLAYIRLLRYPKCICDELNAKKALPPVLGMLVYIGILLMFNMISDAVVYTVRSAVLIGGLAILLYIPYLLRGISVVKKKYTLLLMIIPLLFFSCGCIFTINSSFGIKKVAKVETHIESVDIGMRVDSIEIPKEDALDGETNFTESAIGHNIGDPVTVYELEGCLGIRWFYVSFD